MSDQQLNTVKPFSLATVKDELISEEGKALRRYEKESEKELRDWKNIVLKRVSSSEFPVRLKKSVASAVSTGKDIAYVSARIPPLRSPWLFNISNEADFVSDVLTEIRNIFIDATEIYIDAKGDLVTSGIQVGVTDEGNQILRDIINPPTPGEIAKPKTL